MFIYEIAIKKFAAPIWGARSQPYAPFSAWLIGRDMAFSAASMGVKSQKEIKDRFLPIFKGDLKNDYL